MVVSWPQSTSKFLTLKFVAAVPLKSSCWKEGVVTVWPVRGVGKMLWMSWLGAWAIGQKLDRASSVGKSKNGIGADAQTCPLIFKDEGTTWDVWTFGTGREILLQDWVVPRFCLCRQARPFFAPGSWWNGLAWFVASGGMTDFDFVFLDIWMRLKE